MEPTTIPLCNQKITLPEHWKDLGIYSCTVMIGGILEEAEERMLTCGSKHYQTSSRQPFLKFAYPIASLPTV